ncbi:ATP-binding protein [Phenylobacterium sp.]|uniref:ATP-binding protein n=1 Tax=Phenylobacterium sp. TaxID=1871053 RepID=UPI0027357BCF|nr:ATP-binding protein [Phenylobacterium sp.]MDP3632418.1 ATP-binding protein [Phenylobacterium sp.]
MKKILSLGALLQIIAGVMVASLVITCAVMALHAYHRQQAAQRVLLAAEISRDLFHAMQGLRLERGAVAIALTKPGVPPAEALRGLNANRAGTDAAIKSALARLQRARLDRVVSDGPALRRLVEEIDARRATFLRLRQVTDRAMAAPDPNRSDALRQTWLTAGANLVDTLGELSGQLSNEAIQADPFIARMMTIKQVAWLERDAAGLDTMLLGEAVGRGRPPTAAEREALAKVTGAVDAPHRMMSSQAGLAFNPPRLKAAIAKAERRYFVEFRATRAAALTALSTGAPVDEVALNRDMMESLQSLMDIVAVSFDLTAEHAAHQVEAAERQVQLSIGMMVIACAFGLLSATFIIGRVVRPMARITQAMGDVAAGDLDSEIPFEFREDEIGRLAQALGVFRRNALERREMEDVLVRSQVAKEAAESANKMKSQFLANMSHEIRTPLNGVLGMVQVMEREALAPDQRERLHIIRDSGAGLLQVLNDVLDISKIEAGKLDLAPVEFDIETLATRTVSTFTGAAAARRLDLEVTVDLDATGVWLGDADRIRQILSNLLSNGVKFTDVGAVSLEVTTTPKGLDFIVRDSGIGMSAEALPKLFSKFTQVDDSNERRFGGTGLGLAISRELVELMGGAIEVTSSPGKGSEFRVSLPLPRVSETPRATASVTPGEITLPQDRPLRILAAEDNPTNQKVLAALLAPLDVQLTVVGDGLQAVSTWATADFDVILMDIQMPEMGGVAAALAIRQAEAAQGMPPIPIIALSANAMSHQIAEYMAAGMTAYVAKPIEVGVLYETIGDALAIGETRPGVQAQAV